MRLVETGRELSIRPIVEAVREFIAEQTGDNEAEFNNEADG
ncbi:MAG: hypothetical protein R3C10_04560 [Pirellulales bacterium]